MSELKICPFCGGEEMYETKRENELGTIIPQLFCNCCKMTFEIENDSPYLNDDKTYDYLKEKLHNLWNTRKPMQNIVERLEEEYHEIDKSKKESYENGDWERFDMFTNLNRGIYKAIAIVNTIVKEEGGLNEN